MELDALKQFIQEEMTKWAAEYIATRKAYLLKRKISASGELIRSLEFELNAQASREAVEMLLAFEEHGRFVDMKGLQPPEGGGEYIAGLVDWMQRKGLADRFTERYMERHKLRKVPERVLVYIAWGIALSRTDKYKRRAWYNKSRSGATIDLFNNVAAGIPDIVGGQIKKQFDNGRQTG